MIIDPTVLERRQRNWLINGLVAPRPIAWVSTIGSDGSRNLAPFSFFNAFSFSPPTVGVAPGSRRGVNKDSLRNIKETGEFVISVVNEELAERANACSAEFPPEVDEWEVANVTPAESRDVRPSRVDESPVSFECRAFQIVDLGPDDIPTNSLVLGRVSCIHIDDDAIEEGIPRPDVLRLVGRMGGDLWCRTTDRFELPRPASRNPDEVTRALSSSGG